MDKLEFFNKDSNTNNIEININCQKLFNIKFFIKKIQYLNYKRTDKSFDLYNLSKKI